MIPASALHQVSAPQIMASVAVTTVSDRKVPWRDPSLIREIAPDFVAFVRWVLDGHDASYLGQPPHERRREAEMGGSRVIIDDDRQTALASHSAEVLEDFTLSQGA